MEPKPHFANERTMIHWFHMASTVTALASGILAFGEDGSTTELFGLLLAVFACFLVVYAVRTFHVRGDKIRQRQQVLTSMRFLSSRISGSGKCLRSI